MTNNFDILIDEVKLFLEGDKDFVIDSIHGNFIKIKCLSPKAFRLGWIMAKIIGPITYHDCMLKLYLHYHEGNKHDPIEHFWIDMEMTAGKVQREYFGQFKIEKGWK